MEFKQFNNLLKESFKEMSEESTHLFEVDVDKDELWNLYLDSFPVGTNEIFRERRYYDCGCCRHFIKNFGSVVIIKNNKINTIWDFKTNETIFQPVINALSKFIKSKMVSDVYVTKMKKIGTNSNFEQLDNGNITEWHHFYIELPSKFVDKSNRKEGDIKGSYRDTRNVFKRSLDEIAEESLLAVLELISQNSLYKGEEWKNILNEFLKHKKDYDNLHTAIERENYAWEQSVKIGGSIGRIRNHSIGTLLLNISEGMDLDTAVKKYEVIVAPSNYKRPKAIYTKRMIEEAKKTVIEMGFDGSLERRFATLDDITINNILFSNKDSAKRLGGMDIFEEMTEEVNINPKKFSKVEEILIENFIDNVLPDTREIEVLLENKSKNNMVSLIAPKNKESKTMFKWSNGFSWAYSGNMTDSLLKERVKSAGGKIDGVLRFSIQWNDEEYNPNDFDAHCIEPRGNEIHYANTHNYRTSGELDVDIISPVKGVPSVENITWSNINKMESGVYKFFVRNFSHRGGRSGFKAEIEFNGQVYTFDYNKELKSDEDVQVAEVTLDTEGSFAIKEKINSHTSSTEVWNLKTNKFIPVSVVMYSPNYWDEQKGIGHRHYFFMMKDCINNENPNGFYNEFLKEDLLKHKRVFEALGSKMKVDDVEDQLSGLGFSSTKRNDLVVKVKGNTERIIKIKF